MLNPFDCIYQKSISGGTSINALCLYLVFYGIKALSAITLSPTNPLGVSYAYKVEYYNDKTKQFGSTLNMYLTQKPTTDFVLSFKIPDGDVIDYYGDWELRSSPFSKRNYLKKGNLLPLTDSNAAKENKYPMQFKFYFNALCTNASVSDPNNLVLTDYALLENDVSPNAIDLVNGKDYENINNKDLQKSPFGVFRSGLGVANSNSEAPTKSIFTMIKEYGQDSDGTKFIIFPVGLVVYSVIFVIGATFYLWGTITRLRMRSKYFSRNEM